MIRLIIEKAHRKLSVWEQEVLVFSCPGVLGYSPQGHKQAEGDGRTPEGIYQICTRNDQSHFYLSLGLNYPNQQDGAAALAAGRISAEQAQAITQAELENRRPPWNTALGGQIMIHGQRDGEPWQAGSDWTAGCISVSNANMDRLWLLCPLGTIVEIRP